MKQKYIKVILEMLSPQVEEYLTGGIKSSHFCVMSENVFHESITNASKLKENVSCETHLREMRTKRHVKNC